MSYTAEPDDKPASQEEQAEIENILRCLRIVRSHGGWGEVCVNMKAGDVIEIQTTYTEKPDKPPKQGR